MKIKWVAVLLLTCCWAAFSAQASAQSTITCESKHHKRNYCRIDDPRVTVEMVQQLSQEPCVRGQSWGNDGQGIWVDRGCRAVFRLTIYGGRGPVWWNSGGGRRPGNQPRQGACFFRDPNFGGDYFCLKRGENIDALPPGFNDQISSVRVFGGAAVTIYNDSNFRSNSATFRRSIDNLKEVRLEGYSNKSWNNRISSVQVF
ncbi:MAG: DUF3011 domain-containing protein [Candidatus Acidiferrales bacterium]